MVRGPQRRSRRDLLAAAGASATLLLAGCGDDARSGGSEPLAVADDLTVLDGLARLERMQAAVYERVAEVPALAEDARELANVLAADEVEHAKALEGLLADRDRRPAAAPTLAREALRTADPDRLLDRVADFERLTSRVYLGQLGALRDETARRVVVTIHSAEWRQVAAWAQLADGPSVLAQAAIRPLPIAVVASELRAWTA